MVDNVILMKNGKLTTQLNIVVLTQFLSSIQHKKKVSYVNQGLGDVVRHYKFATHTNLVKCLDNQPKIKMVLPSNNPQNDAVTC